MQVSRSLGKLSRTFRRPCYGGAMHRSTPVLTALALCLFLPACASGSADYPSLARRDAERLAEQPQPAGAETPAPAPGPALEARLARLVNDAGAAHRRFSARTAAARTASARPGASTRGGDAWINAQVALSALEAARSTTMVSLAELDRLYADARLAWDAGESPEAAAIARARTQVDGWAAEQDRAIAAILSRIGG